MKQRKMKTEKAFLVGIIFVVALARYVFISSVNAATPEEIQDAAELEILRLAARQNSDGSWGGDDRVERTGLAVLMFETHAEQQGIDPLNPSYQYYDQVRNGLDYIFSKASIVSISKQPAGDPDTDGNGVGVRIYYSRQIYETGIAAMAIAASRHPEMVVNIPSSAVYGWTFEEVVVNVVDYIAWGQNDAPGNKRGGWGPNLNSSENYVSGCAVLGLVYASSPPPIGFGLTIPQFVKDELSIWIDYIQTDVSGSTNDGGSGYTAPNNGVNILETGNSLQQMAFVGDTLATQRVQDALAYIERHWNGPNTDQGWKGMRPHMQAVFNLMRGLEAFNIDNIDVDGDGVPELDWFDDTTNEMVAALQGAGSWANDPWENFELATLWALLVLQREAPPILKYDLTVSVLITDIQISGASIRLIGPEPRSGTTGVDGSVEFSRLLVGEYTVEISVLGYQSSSTSFTLDEDKTVKITPNLALPVVIPEYPLGAILGLVICFATLEVFKSKRVHPQL